MYCRQFAACGKDQYAAGAGALGCRDGRKDTRRGYSLLLSGAMQRRDFHIDIPDELIAQVPPERRGDSRLLVLDGQQPGPEHTQFADLGQWLRPGDHLVLNDTRVVPARLHARKESGGAVEMLLERFTSERSALVKLRASKSPRVDTLLLLSDQVALRMVERVGEFYHVELAADVGQDLKQVLDEYGEVPLPPYIERTPDAGDLDRYQTVYARHDGAVAAPTAGLHFSEQMLEQLQAAGVAVSTVTLHVGAGTFQPVRVDDLDQHEMHHEYVEVSEETVAAIAATQARGGRVIAVGTTSVRSLEAAASANNGVLAPFSGETRLFLRPGSRFHVIDGMITNFHLPESTLIMLVCAFAGVEATLAAYRDAVARRYRFYSYGDAMLVWPMACLLYTSPSPRDS